MYSVPCGASFVSYWVENRFGKFIIIQNEIFSKIDTYLQDVVLLYIIYQCAEDSEIIL